MSSPESARKRRDALARAQGRTLREYKSTGLAVTDKAAWRREYKRLQRREAGARLRAEIAAQAQAKREAELATREKHDSHVKALRELQASLHDAHVHRYSYVLRDRQKYANRYKENPHAERDRSSRRKQKLPDSYVIQNLKSMGIPRDAVTPELIGLKREHMEYRRLSRDIKSTVKNHLKEQNETITKHP